jgi:hypothetical protein
MLRIFTWRGEKPDYSSLRSQVFAVITTYVAVRGLYSLLRPEMATAMRKGFETFVTQDVARIENPETILAVVHLKDMQSYDQLREIEVTPSPSKIALSQTALNQLVDQVTKELIRRCTAA